MEENEKRFLNEMYSAALERTIRRFWILCIILALSFAASVVYIVYLENQFTTETTTTTIESDATDGGSALGIIGDGNEVSTDGSR